VTADLSSERQYISRGCESIPYTQPFCTIVQEGVYSGSMCYCMEDLCNDAVSFNVNFESVKITGLCALATIYVAMIHQFSAWHQWTSCTTVITQQNCDAAQPIVSPPSAEETSIGYTRVVSLLSWLLYAVIVLSVVFEYYIENWIYWLRIDERVILIHWIKIQEISKWAFVIQFSEVVRFFVGYLQNFFELRSQNIFTPTL
jgi:hypothetical protein